MSNQDSDSEVLNNLSGQSQEENEQEDQDQVTNPDGSSGETGSQDNQDAPSSEPQLTVPEELEGWIGEGKKYRTVEDALNSIPHAQNHIEKLENQIQELKQKMQEGRTVDDLLNELNSGQSEQSEQPSGEAQNTEEDIQTIVERTIEQRERQQTAKQNAQEVVETLQNAFGEKAQEVYKERAENLGMTPQDLDNVARKSPSAAKRLLGVDTQQSNQQPSVNSNGLRTEGLGQGGQVPDAKPVMGGANKSDLIDSWQRAGERAKAKYGG